MSRVYYGINQCQAIRQTGEKCDNKAYFSGTLDGNTHYMCGVHIRKCTNKKDLPKSPAAVAAAKNINDNRRMLLIMRACEQNKANNVAGRVVVSKFKMMKETPHSDGHVSIFPNFKHGGRTDGIGMPGLSPMSLGPVEHNMRRFPAAKCVENYYQFAKALIIDINEDGTISKKALSERIAAYSSSIPHRRKPAAYEIVDGKKITPLYSVHYDSSNAENHYNYIESRWFYCVWYEYLARKTPEYARLVQMRADGNNLNIIGYDGYDVSGKTLWQCYNDGSRPFGHELVLYSMLVGGDNGVQPWHRYASEHPEKYTEFIKMFNMQ